MEYIDNDFAGFVQSKSRTIHHDSMVSSASPLLFWASVLCCLADHPDFLLYGSSKRFLFCKLGLNTKDASELEIIASYSVKSLPLCLPPLPGPLTEHFSVLARKLR